MQIQSLIYMLHVEIVCMNKKNVHNTRADSIVNNTSHIPALNEHIFSLSGTIQMNYKNYIYLIQKYA